MNEQNGQATKINNSASQTADDKLTDLPISDGQQEEVKGGQGVNTAGTVRVNNLANLEAKTNHNETVMAEKDEEGENALSLADLPVTEEQEEQISGGIGNTYRGTTSVNNGILTVQ